MIEQFSEINLLVDEYYPSSETIEPIYDGILDIQQFSIARRKVLWILKEPHDEFDASGSPCGGGWSLSDGFKDKEEITMGLHRIMAVLCYCIENKFYNIDSIDAFYDKKAFVQYVKKVSYINIKKYPGRKTSDDNEIREYYRKTKPLIMRQLFTIDPEIIIFGLHGLFQNEIRIDLGLRKEELRRKGDASYFFLGRKLMIEVTHPSKPGLSAEPYLNNILSAIKEWEEYTN